MPKLNTLIEHRDAILIAEIGALIHDLGKLSEEFILQMSSDSSDKQRLYSHSVILDNNTIVNESLRSSLRTININLLGQTLQLGDLIEKHHSRRPPESNILLQLLMAKFEGTDGVDSGIDKGAVQNHGKQISNDNSISTSFGYEYERIVLNNLKKYRDEFVFDLNKFLNQILDNKEHPSNEDWLKIRKGILNSMESHFKKSPGETRRSANDVTLWDHSYSVASLYKSSLANVILGGQNDPAQMKWRLLSIHFDGMGFWMTSGKIGDIFGRKSVLEKAMEAVKFLIEVHVPFGNQVYKDENGIVFLVPEKVDDSFLKKEIISIKDDTFAVSRPESRLTGNLEIVQRNIDGTSLDAAINTIFEIATDGELKPLIEVTDETRGAQILGNLLHQRKEYNIPVAHDIKIVWDNANIIDKKKICQICGIKPIGGSVRENESEYKNIPDEKKKAEERKICLDCHIRRTNRVKEWLEKRKRTKDTLWIDEIVDSNKRVALIAGKFELTEWLNGNYLNSIFTKTFNSLKDETKENDKSPKKILSNINNFDDLTKAAIEAFDKNGPDKSLSFKKANNEEMKVRDFLGAIGGDSYRQSEDNSGNKTFPTTEKYFEDIVLNREGGLIKNIWGDPEKIPNEKKANLLITALFRKNPSFARMRRLWESTGEFWTSIETDIKKDLGSRKIDRYILKSKITNKINSSIYGTHAYELHRNGMIIPVVNSEDSEFITIDRIRFENPEEKLKGKYELYESSGYGIKSKRIAEIEIKTVEKDSEYIPYIQILEEPTSFMALVPLEQAFDAVKIIKKQYEIQFSKVQNRLPIKLGIIAFNKMMPLYTVIDAANRFFEEDININSWKVKEATAYSSIDNCRNFDGKLGNFVRKIVLEEEAEGKIKRKINCCISYSLGDPTKKDDYYPYFEVKGKGINEKNSYFKTLTINEKEFTLLHVSDIDKDMEVDFRPSIFDFELLDSNSRRFDFGKKRNHWLFGKNGTKPYLLWDIDKFIHLDELISKTGLTTTQILNAYEMLIGTLEDWKLKDLSSMNSSIEFKNLVECAIRDIPFNLSNSDMTKKGQITTEDFDFLRNCMINGMFIDYVDLVHTILKKEFGGIK